MNLWFLPLVCVYFRNQKNELLFFRNQQNELQLEEKKRQIDSLQSKINILETENNQSKRLASELHKEIHCLQQDNSRLKSDLETAKKVKGNLTFFEFIFNEHISFIIHTGSSNRIL